MSNIEQIILRNILTDETYMRKVIPFIKSDYNEEPHQRIVFEEIDSFVLNLSLGHLLGQHNSGEAWGQQNYSLTRNDITAQSYLYISVMNCF